MKAAQKRQKATKLNWIYCPKSFDVTKYGIDPKYDLQVRYLLNCIWYYRVTGKRDATSYVQLSSSFLGPLFGRKNLVKPIRKMCVKAGLIESNNHYVVDEESIGYRLGPKTRDLDFAPWDLHGHKPTDRFAKFKAEVTDYDLDELGLYFQRWIGKVKVGKVAARHVIAGMPAEKANVARAQLGYLEQGVVGLKYCKYGRFHSPFTRLCSELRPLMTIEGKPLFEVDVVNSQPTFLAGLVAEDAATSSGDLAPYLEEFFQDVEDGTIYEKFMTAYGITDRREAKDMFFSAVYGKNPALGPFERLYPVAAALIRDRKRQHGYKSVPREMQKRESEVVLRGAADRLRRDHPDVPVVTVHDSIMTTEENLQLVRNIILQAFSGQVIIPRIRIKGE